MVVMCFAIMLSVVLARPLCPLFVSHASGGSFVVWGGVVICLLSIINIIMILILAMIRGQG